MFSNASIAGVGFLAVGLVLSAASAFSSAAAETVAPPPVKIAVFNFELQDDTPASALLNQATSSTASIDRVSREARRVLAQSGRYQVIDVSQVHPDPAKGKTLRTCDGCEAGIALQLGADQSAIGVVQRATQTDYYIVIRIRDARTGKVVDQQEANFAGSEEGWPTGVRMLIQHQILVDRD
ncbi:MAG TPA: DUF2380 domain-containing protein [Steroidobacteraceae bacterium]|nr:DUF2380 domain-containing protein [Steroidobacteraceae bacterium]